MIRPHRIVLNLLYAGCLVHTQCPSGKKPLCFVDIYEYPHDANLTINILLWCLEKHSPLPPVVHLQFDNCFRENKNRYIFGVCALLIELKIVKKVRKNKKWLKASHVKMQPSTLTDHSELPPSGSHTRRCRSDVFSHLRAPQESGS